MRAGKLRHTITLQEKAHWVPAGSMLPGKAGVLPGVASNYFSTPDSAALDITGDIDIRAKVMLNDWTPTGSPYIVSKNGVSSAYHLRLIGGTGQIRFGWFDGSTARTADSVGGTGFADGSTHWIRATMDVDAAGSPSEYAVKFYTSEDGITWTQLGATKTGAGPTQLSVGTAVLAVGMFTNGTSDPLDGHVHYADVRNGIDGTVVAEFDPSDWTSGSTWTADTGEVWTINSSGSPSIGIVADTPKVNGAGQTGASLITDGWKPNASGVLLAGDYVGTPDELNIVAANVDADNYGNATLTFERALIASPADNAPLDFDGPDNFPSGEPGDTWQTFQAAIPCSISPLSGRELFAAQQFNSQVTHSVRLRYLAGVTDQMRVKYGTRYFTIHYLRNLEERNIELELLCSEGLVAQS
jgi:SPP1 family predicted phage head-tail adaptor